MYVNLLPRKLALRLLLVKRMRQWGLMGVAILMSGMIVFRMDFQSLSAEQAKLEALAEHVRPLLLIQNEAAACERRLATVQVEMDRLRAIQPRDHTLNLLGILSQAAKTTENQLHIQRMSLTAGTPTFAAASVSNASATAQANPVAELSSVSLNGFSGGDTVLTRFVDSLRASAVFEKVELKSSTHWQQDETYGRQFQMECRFSQ